ncbi:MAG: TRAP transporter small permease [Peptococcaceae bacterium]
MKSILFKIVWLLKVICAVEMVAIVVVTFGQVICRYVLKSSIFWAEEFAAYSMLWVIFLASAIGVFEGSHTRIDFFIKAFPEKYRHFLEAATNMICIIFMGLLCYYTVPVIQMNMKTVSSVMKVPLAILSIAVFVGGVLMALFFAVHAYCHLTGKSINQDGGREAC